MLSPRRRATILGWLVALTTLAAAGHAAWSWAWAQRWYLSSRDAIVRHAPDAQTRNRLTSIRGRTLNAILSTAPSRLEWELFLREGEHRFLADAGVEGPATEGATVRLLVIERGQEREVARRRLGRAPAPWEARFTTRGHPINLVVEIHDASPSVLVLGQARVLESSSPVGLLVALAIAALGVSLSFLLLRRSGRSQFRRVALRPWLAVATAGLALFAGELLLRARPLLRSDIQWAYLDRIVATERDSSAAPEGVWRERGWVPVRGRCFGMHVTGDLGGLALAGYGLEGRDVRVCTRPDGFRALGRQEHGAHTDPAVAVVGDSFVQAYNVNDADLWTEVLSRRLRAPIGNFGIAGYGPQQEMSVLRHDALRPGTQLVLWSYFEANDPTDAASFMAFREAGLEWGALSHRREIEESPSARHRNHHRLLISAVAQSLYDRLWSPGPSTSIARTFNPVCQGSGPGRRCMSFEPGSMLLGTMSHAEWRRYLGWIASMRVLRNAARLAQRRGARFAVVLIPSKESLYLPLMRDAVDAARFRDCTRSDTSFDAFLRNHRAQHEVTLAELEASHIEVIDLEPVLREAAERGDMLYFPDDTHWSPAGHTVAADHVADELLRRALVTRARD
ncbi:MAG: hypothetical protein IT378_14435 [Sandaracinaceae bacterium]|nr:hypothetical protein [Sandaracinaceae bacterium]